MNKIPNIFAGFLLAAATAVALASCEKVIDVNVNSAPRKYVIEGIVTDAPGGSTVRISRTRDLEEDNSISGVSGATVVITDDAGRTFALAETMAGIYRSPLRGVPGRQYTLRVTAGGQTFSASVRMPQPVAPDSLYITWLNFGGAPERQPNVVYRDPAGKGNAYRFVLYRNSLKATGIYIENDDFTDGRRNIVTLYGGGENLERGDTLRVEMLSIDPAIYDYWYSLAQSATGESQSASPANPITNLTGGALGYFSAETITGKSMVVNE